jgi:hypothetical protein
MLVFKPLAMNLLLVAMKSVARARSREPPPCMGIIVGDEVQSYLSPIHSRMSGPYIVVSKLRRRTPGLYGNASVPQPEFSYTYHLFHIRRPTAFL